MKIKSLLLTISFIFICTGLLPAQDLINAVKTGDIKEVRKLLPYSNMEERDEFNCTPYHWTAILGYREIAELLLYNSEDLKYDADPNALVIDPKNLSRIDGKTIYTGSVMGAPSAPVLAQENKKDNLIDFFLSQGDIDLHLRSAVMCDNKVVTERAIEKGGDPNMMINMGGERLLSPAIKLSFESGSEEIVDALIRKGADVSAAFLSSFVNGNTKEDSAVWEKLLDKGANINQKFKKDTLSSFAYKKDINKLDFLVKHGVDLTVKYNKGRTLLHNAVEAQNNVNILIPPSNICDRACMINYLSIRDDNGETACDIAKRKLNGLTNEYAQQNAEYIKDLVCDETIEKNLLKNIQTN